MNDQFNGSFSMLLKKGLNATFAAGTQNLANPATGQDDPTFWYAKLGYIANYCKIGPTAFAVDYGQYDDVA